VNVKTFIAIAALVVFVGLSAQASAQVVDTMNECHDLGPVAFETGPFQKFWGSAIAYLFGEPKQVHMVRCVDEYSACYFMAKINTPNGKNQKALQDDPEFVGLTKAKEMGEFSCVPIVGGLPGQGGGDGTGQCCTNCTSCNTCDDGGSGSGDSDSDHKRF
jgi:hypothetical protein